MRHTIQVLEWKEKVNEKKKKVSERRAGSKEDTRLWNGGTLRKEGHVR